MNLPLNLSLNLPLLITLMVISLVLLIYYADKFVNYSVIISHILGLSPGVIGLTVVSLGTSLPELVIAGTSATMGLPYIAYGNIIGSNIANFALVLGLTILIKPLLIKDTSILKDINILICVSILFGLSIIDGKILLIDGIVMLALLIAIITYQIITKPEVQTNKQRDIAVFQKFGLWVKFALSLFFIYLFSRLFVYSTKQIAVYIGMSDIVIGLTIVALGTSLPELVTSIVAVFKKQTDLAIGNLVGSNLFNLLGGIGIASIITPIALDYSVIIRDYTIMMLVLFLLLIPFIIKFFKPAAVVTFNGILGLIFLSIYVGYMYYLL